MKADLEALQWAQPGQARRGSLVQAVGAVLKVGSSNHVQPLVGTLFTFSLGRALFRATVGLSVASVACHLRPYPCSLPALSGPKFRLLQRVGIMAPEAA